MSLNYTGIEIKTLHSLESWNGGVLVMVSGSLQLKDFTRRRKFVETFFLAPQEKGYFVLNNIFHFIEEELIHQHPAVLLAQTNLEAKLSASMTIPEPGINPKLLLFLSLNPVTVCLVMYSNSKFDCLLLVIPILALFTVHLSYQYGKKKLKKSWNKFLGSCLSFGGA